MRKSVYIPVLLCLLLFLSFFRLGSLSLFDVDEAVFSEATKEMVESGDWLTPTYNGVNRYDKPILFYWLMAVSYKIFGINEFGARFPSALAGALLSIMLFLFMLRNAGLLAALYAASSFALSIYFAVYSHAAVTDMTLTLFIALSLFSFHEALRLEGSTAGYFMYGFYFFSALAFLTKGLIGIVFPFGIALLYVTVVSGLSGVKKIFSPVGVLLFLVVAAPWYIAEYSVNGREFIEQFFIKHHFRRYTGVISGHSGPLYFYIPVLAIGLLPWIVYLPEGVAAAWRKFRDLSSGRGERPGGAPELLALIWFSGIVVFFSLSTTKLPNYILPSIPAAAILISAGMTGQSLAGIRYTKVFIAGVSLLLAAGAFAAPVYLPRIGIADSGWLFPIAVLMCLSAALNIAGAISRKSYHLPGAVLMLGLLILLSVRVFPVANAYQQGFLKKAGLYAKEHLGREDAFVVYNINYPSLVFYSGHRVISAYEPGQVGEIIKSGKKVVVIAKASEAGILAETGLTVVDKDRAFALFERK